MPGRPHPQHPSGKPVGRMACKDTGILELRAERALRGEQRVWRLFRLLAGWGLSSLPWLPWPLWQEQPSRSLFPRLTLNSLVMLAFPAVVWHQGLGTS